jgi:hypothetical protein
VFVIFKRKLEILRPGDVAQVVENLPSMFEVLSSNSPTAKTKPAKQTNKPYNISPVPVTQTVILATWEAEIRRIMVQGQPRQKVRPLSINIWAHVPVIPNRARSIK